MLKWIYNLGVMHERNRIKRLISEFATRSTHELNMLDFELQNTDKPRKMDKLKRDYELKVAARRIVNQLLEPQFVREYMTSPIDDDNPKGSEG